MSVAPLAVASTQHEAVDRRSAVDTLAVLGVVAGAAWCSTVVSTREMSSMTYGLAQAGRDMAFSTDGAAFAAMWATMMAAMMLPSIAPVVSRFRSPRSVRPAALFTAGYLGLWTLTGVLPWAALVALGHVTHPLAWLDRAGGAVFMLAGGYQLSRSKAGALGNCRATGVDASGPIAAARAGVVYGIACLGCCWALMSALFVVGLMNLAWMVGLATVLAAEKNWRHGTGLAHVAGVALCTLGLLVLVHPSLLGSLALVHHKAAMMSG